MRILIRLQTAILLRKADRALWRACQHRAGYEREIRTADRCALRAAGILAAEPTADPDRTVRRRIDQCRQRILVSHFV